MAVGACLGKTGMGVDPVVKGSLPVNVTEITMGWLWFQFSHDEITSEQVAIPAAVTLRDLGVVLCSNCLLHPGDAHADNNVATRFCKV